MSEGSVLLFGIQLRELTMSEKQKLLAEIFKLKMYLVKKLSSHTLRIETQEVLDKLNEIIENIEKM